MSDSVRNTYMFASARSVRTSSDETRLSIGLLSLRILSTSSPSAAKSSRESSLSPTYVAPFGGRPVLVSTAFHGRRRAYTHVATARAPAESCASSTSASATSVTRSPLSTATDREVSRSATARSASAESASSAAATTATRQGPLYCSRTKSSKRAAECSPAATRNTSSTFARSSARSAYHAIG